MEKRKDEEILALSVKNPGLFGILVDRHQKAFLRAAYKIVNHSEESEDVVQEAFVKIYRYADKFKEREGASFKSWAYKIVINTALTHYKKLKVIQKSAEYLDYNFYENEVEVSVNGMEMEIDEKIMVSKVLKDMPVQLRAILKKYYLEDKSQKDIALEENISVMAVKMRLFRAKKFLKKLMETLETNKNLSWIA